MAKDDAKSSQSMPPGTPAAEAAPGLNAPALGAIALKSPVARGGPSVSRPPSASRPPNASPRPAGGDQVPAANGQPGVRSAIKGLDDETYTGLSAISPTQLNFGMHNQRFDWRRLWVLVGIGAVTGMSYIALFTNVVQTTISRWQGAKSAVVDLGRKQKRHDNGADVETPPATRRQGALSSAADTLAQPEAAANSSNSAAARRGCGDLVRLARSGEQMAIGDRVAASGCFAAIDDWGLAEATLKPLSNKLMQASDEVLEQNARIIAPKTKRGDADLGDAFLTMLDAQLHQGKTRNAGELLHGRCLRWAQSLTCVGRLMLVVKIKAGGGDTGRDDLKQIFETRGELSPKLQAYLDFNGATLAQLQGHASTADQRLARALASAPRTALSLRKQIYETQAMMFYDRGATAKQAGITNTALSELRSLDAGSSTNGALTKLKILRDLATPQPLPRQTIASLLARSDVLTKARTDMPLIEILGLEAMRSGAIDSFIRIVNGARESRVAAAHRNGGLGLDAELKKLAIWETRAQLSKGDYEQGLRRLDTYDRDYGGDALSHHLRGVTYTFMALAAGSSGADTATGNSSATGDTGYIGRYYKLAIREFQAAVRSRPDWETFYALGSLLIKTGHGKDLAPLIRDLDRQIHQLNLRSALYWRDMLVAEWSIDRGQYLNAEKILATWRKAEPDRITPIKLLLQLDQKTGKNTRVQQARIDLDDLSQRPRAGTVSESLSSPLGAMALGKRPI